jgi:acyl carrier protein
MNRGEIISAIGSILRDTMQLPHAGAFAPTARLNEDLYLDSVLILQIFLNLELEYGLPAVDEIINRQDIVTVEDLAGLFADAPAEPLSPAAAPEGDGVHGEAYYDIKVHCFVSCVCEGLKKAGLDHRPFYFGVWDADFAVSEQFELLYHTPAISQEFFRSWFETLYGAEVREWYDHGKSKDENLSTMLDLIERRGETGYVMVMVDLFHLPERENKFNQNPFPHYLMIETSGDPEIWNVLDPDYRWQGQIERAKIINAMMQPSVAGGYVFDRSEARAPVDEDLRDYFHASFHPRGNPLVDAVRRIVAAHLDGLSGRQLPALASAVRELPVISIRKYAYEHGFAFFWRALKLPSAEFDIWCDEIEALFQELKSLHYACMKLSQTRDHNFAADVFKRLDNAERIEDRIKNKLQEVFGLWCESRGIAASAAQLTRGVSR